MKSNIPTWLFVVGLVVGLLVIKNVINMLVFSPSSPASPRPQPLISAPATAPAAPAYSKEQRESARVLMDTAKRGHHIYEEGPHLVVEMKSYIEDKNSLLRFVRSIADADCVLNNGPRNIYYYDPSMKKVAQADPLGGVRLLD